MDTAVALDKELLWNETSETKESERLTTHELSESNELSFDEEATLECLHSVHVRSCVQKQNNEILDEEQHEVRRYERNLWYMKLRLLLVCLQWTWNTRCLVCWLVFYIFVLLLFNAHVPQSFLWCSFRF